MDYCVVIPAYNAAQTIAEAVASVMAQTAPPAEIIVVDDGSTDATPELVSGLAGPITLIRQANQGPGAATTAGIKAASAPLLAGLDADDLWLPAKMARQMEALEAEPGWGGVFCRIASFLGEPASADYGGARDGWVRSTMLVRTERAVANGAVVNPPGGLGDMVDWFARLRENGNRLAMLQDVLALRRIRPGSMTYGRSPEAERGYLHAARQAILRRRQRGADGEG